MTHRLLPNLNLQCVLCVDDLPEHMAIKNMEYSALDDSQVASEPEAVVCSMCHRFA